MSSPLANLGSVGRLGGIRQRRILYTLHQPISRLLYFVWNQVKVIEAIHIEELQILKILEFVKKHWKVELYLPEYVNGKYSSRKWILKVGKQIRLHYRD